MKRYRTSFFILQCCCLIASGMLLAKPIYRWGQREISQRKATALWKHTLATPPVDNVSGAPVLWLRIPGCGIDELVLYQDTKENLNRHPCLAQETPTVILGHRDTHFRKLQQIQLQDNFEIETRDGGLRMYRVTEIEILPAKQLPKRIEEHRDAKSLILVTCHPFTYLGPAPNRFIVWAQPV